MMEWSKEAWLLAAPVALCLYYLIVWARIGREPKRGTSVIRYEPPEGMTPAAVRYLWMKGSDGRSFAAVLANLSVRGIIRITPMNGAYKLEQLLASGCDRSALPPEEARVYKLLFADQTSVVLEPTQQGPLSLYVHGIQDELRKSLEGKFYSRNLGYLLSGAFAGFLFALVASVVMAKRDPLTALFFPLWFLFAGWILGLLVVVNLLPAWKRAFLGTGSIIKLLPGTLVMGVFIGALVFIAGQEAKATSTTMAAVLTLILLLPLVWAPALRRLTPLGTKTLDEIEGFRTFLVKVEQDRLERLNAPDGVLARANEFLPYAIALELREAWGDHLAEALSWATTEK